MLDWISKYAAAIAMIGTGIWTVWQFAAGKRAETKKHQFEAYHHLVKQLVEGDAPELPTRVDRQIAVIYELKNFPLYFPVTRRVLIGLQKDWGGRVVRVDAEIAITLGDIDAYERTKRVRFLKFLRSFIGLRMS